MKTALNKSLRRIWLLLTEVPGWPDAPRGVRIRRALPIALPCVAFLLLAGWNLVVIDPRMSAERAIYQPVQALQDEVLALGMEFSDQLALDVAERAAGAETLALQGAAQTADVLFALKQQAAARGWEATLQASESTDEVPLPDAVLAFKHVRGRLAPLPGGYASFTSLLSFFEQLSAGKKRIDLTRLAIRADEQGRHAVEFNLRLVHLAPHEKAAQ